ncbi:hypothetical protein EJB05_31009 [Eragrostis curvula]|uniref:Uncharacterized protein n=1 Tax=Eragrostis curvula TaxID=38414 RepID=A0A5J9UCA3_9POAL|nr:hypothetical protein EJB05_31009 [Eragrostis curvula]
MLACRRCSSTGSLAAATMAKDAATSPRGRPSLQECMLQTLQRFSSEGREWADPKNPLLMKEKAANVLHMLWQWTKYCVKNVTEADRAKSRCVCTIIVVVANTYYTYANLWALNRQGRGAGNSFGSTNHRIKPTNRDEETSKD